VIHNSIPNAFAFPNGMVFIHTGLLKVIENEAQLALVLGHEISHVLYEHAAQRYARSKYFDGDLAASAWNRVKTLIPKIKQLEDTSRGMNASLNGLVDRLAPQNLSGLFEKTKERQADRVGLFYMYIAGYDLREAPKFWLQMKTLTGDAGFRQKLSNSAIDILQSKDLKFDKSLLGQLGDKGINAVGGALLDNIYASHPLSQQRYDDISELLAVYYKDADFSKAETGINEFRKYIGNIK
jgi:beta-barrel assembly-enhancing protease